MLTTKNSLTFDQLLNKYFFYKRLRPATQWSYQKVIRSFEHFTNQKPESIDKELALKWRKYVLEVERSQPITWNNKVAHMRAVFNFAIENELIALRHNPFNGVVVRPNTKKKKVLTSKQMSVVYCVMQRFLEEENNERTHYHCAIYPVWYWMVVIDTFRYTGIRLNQLQNLRICDVDLDNASITLRTESSKNHKEHRIPIVGPLKPALKQLIERSYARAAKAGDLLFELHRFMKKPPHIRSFFFRLSKECGFTITPHRFRHTIATEMMKSPDRNIQVVKTLLGHSSINSTLEYLDNSVDTIRGVLETEISKMDNDISFKEKVGNRNKP